MNKVNKIYLRNTRDSLGRYPNWPINQKIEIGKVGYFNGRKAEFQWVSSLKNLGVSYDSTNTQQFISELYTSSNSVSAKFTTENKGILKAKFNFSKSNSVVAQGHEMGYKTLDIGSLRNGLMDKIEGGLEWDYDWVIITEIWSSTGFTTLISSSKDSYSKIKAKGDLANHSFNIADVNLSPKIAGFNNMAYQGVAEKKVNPYFQIHRLTKDHRLKRYGKKMNFWGI